MKEDAILSTSFYKCGACGREHACEYRRRETDVFFHSCCPVHGSAMKVSSDAGLFLEMRNKSGFTGAVAYPSSTRPLFGVLEITNACDCSCPVCYADSGTGDSPWFMDLTEVEHRSRLYAEAGGKWLTLTGGEPTCHPLLPEIVRLLRDKIKLRPVVASNGLKMSSDLTYLRKLKRAGLIKVSLQFDTFKPETYRLIRGRECPEEKIEAVRAITGEGLRLGLVTTVTEMNLEETGAVLDFAVSMIPSINTVLFQMGIPLGRVPVWMRDHVDRERAVKALCGSTKSCEIFPSDFYPAPSSAMMKLAFHPDCSAITVLSRKENSVIPCNREIDMERLYGLLRGNGSNDRLIASSFRNLFSLFRSTRKGKRLFILKCARGLMTGKGKNPGLAVTVGSFMCPGTRDDQRLGLCNAFALGHNSLISLCDAISMGHGRVEEMEVAAR